MKMAGITDKKVVKSLKQSCFEVKGMKKYIRILALALALLALPFQMVSCSGKTKVALELNGHKITEGMYS